MVTGGKSPAKPAALPSSGSDNQIFFHLHAGGSAFQWILENPADVLGSFIFAYLSHIIAIDFNSAAVRNIGTGNRVQKGTLTCAVAADDSAEIAVVQSQGQMAKRFLFIGGSLEECFADICNFKHNQPAFPILTLPLIIGAARASMTRIAVNSFKSFGGMPR